MRGLLIAAVLFVLILAVFLPVAYLWKGSELPSLGSEFELERHLRGHIESERMAAVAGISAQDRPDTRFLKPDLTHFPRHLVAFYLSAHECPTYFQTPREGGVPWAWRLVRHQLTGGEPAGDGRCERTFAANIASALKVPPGSARTIASHRLHALLQKDQLVAYDLATAYVQPSIIGADAAARVLFQRPLEELRFEQLAELSLALPPWNWFAELRDCKNPPQLRQARDILISNLRNDGLIPEDVARAATAAPLGCVSR